MRDLVGGSPSRRYVILPLQGPQGWSLRTLGRKPHRFPLSLLLRTVEHTRGRGQGQGRDPPSLTHFLTPARLHLSRDLVPSPALSRLSPDRYHQCRTHRTTLVHHPHPIPFLSLLNPNPSPNLTLTPQTRTQAHDRDREQTHIISPGAIHSLLPHPANPHHLQLPQPPLLQIDQPQHIKPLSLLSLVLTPSPLSRHSAHSPRRITRVWRVHFRLPDSQIPGRGRGKGIARSRGSWVGLRRGDILGRVAGSFELARSPDSLSSHGSAVK
jgi:hypothetical protein